MNFKLSVQKIFPSIIVLSTVLALTSASCEVKDYVSSCSFVVQCTTTVAAINNRDRECSAEAHVKLIITQSNLNYLTTGFFAATNFDSKVREIKAVDNDWKRIESSAFRYYSWTVKIDLTNNKIPAIGEDVFRHLRNLKFLNLSSNNIESIHARSFLISDIRDNVVQELDLSHNKLQYLDSELNELPNLRKLYLQNNYISSVADNAFMIFKNLSHLYLQHNLLTSVNLSLIHLKNLTTLDISNNHLVSLHGYEINRLVAIVDFNVSHNELTFVESDCFNQALNLEKLDFSFNDIKIKIGNVMFINNNKLNYLNFYNNKIIGLEENVFSNCDLTYLNLEKNNITGDIKEKTFINLQNITKLDLSQQYISGIKNNAFTDMVNLLYLNLSRNDIHFVANSSFAGTNKVTVLDLSHNEVRDLYFMKNCLPNLIELYLNNNNITTIPKYIFGNQTQIRLLDLSMNNIFTIEEYSLPLQNLQYLHFMGNHMNGVIKPNTFSPAKYLRFLDLSKFNITRVDNFAFLDLPVLAKLNLSNNYIESIEINSFKGVDNLFSLDLSHNALSELKFNTSKLTNLKALYLNNNNLTNISGLLTSACKLAYLDLSNNNLGNVTEMNTTIFPNLTVLFLDNNNLKHFNNPNINSLRTLIDLGLSSNEITDVKLNYFKELMSVDLSNNKLTYLNRTFLEANEYLQALDVSRNQITELPPGTFQFMKNLKLLNLSSNYLTKLRYGSLKGLHRTEVLDLSRNNIAQLDVDIFHECDELKTLIIDYNRLKTFDVERLILIALRKLRTLSLGGNPISCREIVHNIKSANTTFYAIRQVEVTSIDKIYHEDNVHGIKCGDDPPMLITSTREPNTIEPSTPPVGPALTSSSVVLIWCSVITILALAGGVLCYMKLYKKKIFVVNTNMQLRNSMDLNGSEFQSDLLS